MKTHGTQNSCNVGKSTNEALVVHVFFLIPIKCAIHGGLPQIGG
jgi:hypothetical protein